MTNAPTMKPGTSVAVTGATGFIGGRLVERLLEQGVAVACLVRNQDAGARLRAAGATVRALDIAEPESVRAALKEVEFVFHCAYDWNDQAWNFRALRALIAACGANECRLVHMSSFVVYDTPSSGEMTEAAPETTANHGYAHTKRELDAELLTATRDGKVAAAILQPTVVYGPASKPWTIDPGNMLRHGVVVLPDAGEGICPAVYVDDVVSAMILAAQSPAAVGQRFLINGPEPVTWKQFYESMAQAIGTNGPQYRPSEAIKRTAQFRSGKGGKLLRLVLEPGRGLRKVAGIGPVRKAVQAGLKALPDGLRQRARTRLFGPETCWPGQVHIPDLGHLDFLQNRTTISSAKAQAEMGYAPQFTLSRGMVPTAEYLNGIWNAAPGRKGQKTPS